MDGAGRVVGREVQRLEVEPVVLDLGALGDLVAHRNEHVADPLGQRGQRMPRAGRCPVGGQRDVDRFLDEHPRVALLGEHGEPGVVGGLHRPLGLVVTAAGVGAGLGGARPARAGRAPAGPTGRPRRRCGRRRGHRGRRPRRSRRAPRRACGSVPRAGGRRPARGRKRTRKAEPRDATLSDSGGAGAVAGSAGPRRRPAQQAPPANPSEEGRGAGGQGKSELRAAAVGTAGGDGPAVRLDDPSRDVQAQPGAATPRLPAPELREDPLAESRWGCPHPRR